MWDFQGMIAEIRLSYNAAGLSLAKLRPPPRSEAGHDETAAGGVMKLDTGHCRPPPQFSQIAHFAEVGELQ